MRIIFCIGFFALLMGVFGQDKEVKEEGRKKQRKNKKDTSSILAQPIRIEIPIEDFRDDFEVVEGYEDGLLVVQDTREPFENGDLWYFHFINKELEKEWELNRIIDERAELIAFDYSIGYYFLLFEINSRFRDYKALVIDVEGKAILEHDFETPFEMDIHFFEALDNGILMIGRHNYRPVALIYDLVGNKPQVLPGFYNHNEHVYDVVMDEKKRAFSVVMAERMRNGKYTNRIKTFTYDGLLVVENLIHPGENLNIVDGTTTSFGSGIQYMVGTYSIKTSNYSRGIYVSKFVNGQQRFLKQHNYGDLNNFFAFRGERAAKRIARRVARKKARGKEPKFNYQLFIHEVIPKGDLNIIVAEAYYTKYASSRSIYGVGRAGSFSPYSNTQQIGYPSAYQSFLGYKFTHAIIVAFDSKGDIVWDNSYKTNDITSYNLEESVATNIQGDKAIIAYLDDEQIKSKVVKGNEVLEGKTYNPVKLLYDGDKLVSRNEQQGVRNWYDNFLYSYGTQRIKNKSMPKKERRRKVFYINKLEFETDPDLGEEFPITSNLESEEEGGESVSDLK